MAEQSTPDTRFISTAPAFAICSVCDTQHPAGTPECPKCKSPLSAVRKCPTCSRVVSSKHQRCIYCSTSFLEEVSESDPGLPAPSVTAAPGSNSTERQKAILVSVAVFLLVTFVGLYLTVQRTVNTGGREIVATTYVVQKTWLRLQPNANSGGASALPANSVLSLMNIAVDSEGTRWFEARNGEMTGFVPVVDIAPPKVRLPELGSQMLRAWLLAFRDPALIGEADSAVSYFCTEFAGSRHCDELRWVAAERFGSLGRRDGNEDAINRARKLYATIRDGKGPIAAEAAGALNGLSEPNGGRQRGMGSGSKKAAPGKAISYASGREYALVDKAEVQVRVPNLKSLSAGTVVRAAIAREIQINGKVAVPANAICVMRIADLDSANSHLTIQLTALEFANRRYEVSTVPQKIPSSGALVVFPLEASLLIGK